MAREESDREDLIREAVALVPRAEYELPCCAEPVLIGFKKTGGIAVYIGPDPVYQFDCEHRLRRAYVAGYLFRTQGSTLSRLERVHSETATELRRHDLSAGELREFLTQMHRQLSELLAALQRPETTPARVVPEEESIHVQILETFESLVSGEGGLAPSILGRR